VLLAHWFPRAERARANAFWNLCQPLAVAASAPITGWLLGVWGWRTALIVEGALPFVWLPIWLYYVSDHPRDAKWISKEEKDYLEETLAREAKELDTGDKAPIWQAFLLPAVFVMVPVYFLQNCANYGLMTFLGEGLKGKGMQPQGLQYGLLFAIPYALAAVLMIMNAHHSDKTHERRGHVALAYGVSGAALIASVLIREKSFWASYVCLCFAVPGPFCGLAPFWAIPAETMSRRVLGAVMGLVNAIGNLGGYLGPFIVGALKKTTGGVAIPFSVLGGALLVAAALCFLLPRTKLRVTQSAPVPVGSGETSA
jgi:MFS family permease